MHIANNGTGSAADGNYNVVEMLSEGSGRKFTGKQLPAMMRMYDASFVLIEGIGYMDRITGQLVKKIGRNSYSMGIQYAGYQNFLTSIMVHSTLAGRPCMPLRTVSLDETVRS